MKIRENLGRTHPYLQLSINENLNKPLKEGIYLSNYFLNLFDKFDLWQVLENWSEESIKSKFLKKLTETIQDNLNEIKQDLTEKVKKRRNVIQEIFQLYENKYYFGVTVLVLSQVDGMMKEITKDHVGFYSSTDEKKRKQPNRLKHLDHEISINYFSEFHLLDIKNRNDYMLFKKNINDLEAFNRHSILHGESSQFGTSLNALKAILLLVFIGDLYDINVNSNSDVSNSISTQTKFKKKD